MIPDIKNKPLFAGIILAAGLSSRMKTWKPGKLINGIPLIVYTIRSMLVHCNKIIVVGGYNFEKLDEIINNLNIFSSLERAKILLIENRDYKSGMFSSVKFGLANVSNSEGVFILPGDIPFVNSSTFFTLINNFNTSKEYDLFLPAIKVKSDSPAAEGDNLQKGHPILIRNNILERITSHSYDTSLRNVLKEFSSKICFVNDEGIIFDVDNEDDFKKIKTIVI